MWNRKLSFILSYLTAIMFDLSRYVVCLNLKPATKVAHRCCRSNPTCLSSSFDYEYIPQDDPSAIEDAEYSILPSTYPEGTPAGLRGEAVRSALKSGQCIAWNFSSSSVFEENPLSNGGVLRVQGKGMLDFLNSKLSQSFALPTTNTPTYQEACLLTSRGNVVDRLRVSIVDSETAFILTSPGHSSETLLRLLDPYIFPMDQVKVTNLGEACSFTLASTQWSHVENAIRDHVIPVSGAKMITSSPNPTRLDECAQWEVQEDDSFTTNVLVMPSTGLPRAAAVGHTFVFYGSGPTGKNSVGLKTYNKVIGEDNTKGPVGIGPREYETLRIEAGLAAYGKEFGVDEKELDDNNKKKEIRSSPLEIHWLSETINMEKGCYLGQEGVASVFKNPRGPPRTLYSVVFDDGDNVYDWQSKEDDSNLTRLPKAGDPLFALGSNQEISVGTITSVAEAGGSGDKCTFALALVRRADSIRKQMNAMDLEIARDTDPEVIDINAASGIIEPPPIDPLDGLEVIVGKTFTVGMLQMVPSRRLRKGRNMFDEVLEVEDMLGGDSDDVQVSQEANSLSNVEAGVLPQDSYTEPVTVEEELEQARKEASRAKAEAEAAASEAKRKAEKMEILKKRAEEAMARRKQKKEAGAEAAGAAEAAAAEEKRKAAKMEKLKKRAEEAMARRRKKKEEQ